MATTIDITVPLSSRLPTFPGDPPVTVEPTQRIARGDAYNLTRLTLGSHAGTHVDAPYHFEPDGVTVDQLPLEVLLGPARVVEPAAKERIGRAALEAEGLRGEMRVLIKTAASGKLRSGRFEPNFPHLTPEAAVFLLEAGIKLVGIDSWSVEEYGRKDFAVHHTLLRAGVVIVEGLDLSNVAPGRYDMTCLPLLLQGADGAPARVILRTRT